MRKGGVSGGDQGGLSEGGGMRAEIWVNSPVHQVGVGENIPDGGCSECKGPEVGVSHVSLRTSAKASVSCSDPLCPLDTESQSRMRFNMT